MKINYKTVKILKVIKFKWRINIKLIRKYNDISWFSLKIYYISNEFFK
jgi:hypothetical protein